MHSLESQRREASRKILDLTPGLMTELMKTHGSANYDNGLMGVPTSEEIEEMLSRRWTPVPRNSSETG
jgi:hypothetical protein